MTPIQICHDLVDTLGESYGTDMCEFKCGRQSCVNEDTGAMVTTTQNHVNKVNDLVLQDVGWLLSKRQIR